MGCRLRWRSSLTQCHFLCSHDCLPCFSGTSQSGILQWGVGKASHEQDAQKEEAFVRATVALTRAQQICIIIMQPLDMRALVGAATIIGSAAAQIGSA